MLTDDQEYILHRGDCIPFMAGSAEPFADLAVFSPPFPQLYAYTSQESDIGNSDDFRGDAKIHLSFFFRAIRKAVRPGRVVAVHCMQIPRMKRAGGMGLFDFRGLLIRLGERAGLVFEYDWAIRKNPQAQAITTKSRELQFAGLESDRAASRGALADYILKFRLPGENPAPVTHGDVSRNDWISWAECTWDAKKYPVGARLTMTLNTDEGKSEDDTRHICPMQLSIIDRLVRLYSNPGEVVLDPFTGIGSTGVVSLKLGRRFVGCELKREYQDAAIGNLNRALAIRRESERTLFDTVA